MTNEKPAKAVSYIPKMQFLPRTEALFTEFFMLPPTPRQILEKFNSLESELIEARAEIKSLNLSNSQMTNETVDIKNCAYEAEEAFRKSIVDDGIKLIAKDAIIKQMFEALLLGAANVAVLHGKHSAEYKQMTAAIEAAKGRK